MWSKHTVFDLEMKGTVLPGAVALLGNFEIDAAGIIFDSTLGKPSVCTRKKKKKQASKLWRRFKGYAQWSLLYLLELPINDRSALCPAEVQLALGEEIIIIK